MCSKHWVVPAVLLSLGCYLHVATAKIEYLDVSHDTRRAFHIETFGFDTDGVFEFELRHMRLNTFQDINNRGTHPDVVFILKRSDAAAQYEVREDHSFCFHRAHFDKELDKDDILLNLNQHLNDTLERGKPVVYKPFTERKTFDKPGLYHLWFSNCEFGSAVTFSLTLTEYNVRGTVKDYLSAGESPLPALYFLMFFIFLTEAISWIQVLRKSRAELVKGIHKLMTFVVIVKALSLLFDAVKFHYLKTTGISHGWSVMFYVFSLFKGVSLFLVIVLIGTGWSYMTPFITSRDKKIIVAILVAQVVVNIAMVVEEEMSPGYRYWLNWRAVLLLVDMVCCCIILVPIVHSIKHVRDVGSTKAAKNLQRLQRFRRFYMLTTSFIYVTRILVLLLKALLPFGWAWCAPLLNETATAVFFGLTGYWFRPATQTPYIPLDQEEMVALQTLDEVFPDDDLSMLQYEGDTI